MITSILRSAWLAGIATVLALTVGSAAQAATCTLGPSASVGTSCDFAFTDPGSLGVSTPFGSIKVTQPTATKLSFDVSVVPNFSIDAGQHEAFSFGIGNNSGTPIATANLAAFGHIDNVQQFSGTGTLGIFSGNPGDSSPFGNFNYALTCSPNGGSENCGQHFTFDFIFAAADSGKLIPSTGDANIWFAADIKCNSGCNTGVVGASLVPAPLLGAGLPGIVISCGGLLALARRRRQQIA